MATKLSCYLQNVKLHPWLRAQMYVDEVEMFNGKSKARELISRLLFAHYLKRMAENEEIEQTAYEQRERGLDWLNIARVIGCPYDPARAKALAMAYAYRPTLYDKPRLPWPI